MVGCEVDFGIICAFLGASKRLEMSGMVLVFLGDSIEASESRKVEESHLSSDEKNPSPMGGAERDG